MKIYAFTRDPETGIIFAYFTAAGNRCRCVVWRQADRYHVCTGHKITGDLVRWNFSEAQTAAYLAFRSSSAYSVDFEEGLA